MKFLGSCEVCHRVIPTYRALGQHFRWQKDAAHQDLEVRWRTWTTEYHANLYCRKCGELFEISDKKDRNKKRCPKCEESRRVLGKRKYEGLCSERVPDTRQVMTAKGSKAQWDGLVSRRLTWVRGDALCQEIVKDGTGGVKVGVTMERLGVSYDVYVEVMQDAVGVAGYAEIAQARKAAVARHMASVGHAKYNALTPEDKAVLWSKRFKKGSLLEALLVKELRTAGVSTLKTGVWQSLPFSDGWHPREADIKIDLGANRKVVVLCDGEAFHGPKYIYPDVAARIQDDVETAKAYFAQGYSIIRYAESEIKAGVAIKHLMGVLDRLRVGGKVYRTWYPLVEVWE